MSAIGSFVSEGRIQRVHPEMVSGTLCHLSQSGACLSTHTDMLPAWQSLWCVPSLSAD